MFSWKREPQAGSEQSLTPLRTHWDPGGFGRARSFAARINPSVDTCPELEMRGSWNDGMCRHSFQMESVSSVLLSALA